MNRVCYELKSFSMTDVGPLRDNNEDSFYAAELTLNNNSDIDVPSQAGLYILCDGMGGHEKGEVASITAVEELKSLMHSLLESPNIENLNNFEELIIQAVRQANDKILQLNIDEGFKHDQRRMGTTVVMVVVLGASAWIVHVGDSRCYLVEENAIQLLTQDHNLANQLLAMGVFKTEEEAFASRGAKALTQALGPREGKNIHPSVTRYDFDSPAFLLLCSDGLSDVVSDQEIGDIVNLKKSSIKNMVKKLVRTAYKNNTADNVTIILVKVDNLISS